MKNILQSFLLFWRVAFTLLLLLTSGKPGCADSDSQQKTQSNNVSTINILEQYPNASEPFEVEVLAEDQGVIWAMDFIDDHHMLFTERKGQFKILNIQNKNIYSVSGSPQVYERGQGGLMDIALHPDFSNNKKVYFTYSKEIGSKQTTALAQGIFAGIKEKKIKLVKDIFLVKPFASASIHFGSRLVFDKDGFLFMAMGDRHQRHKAQSLNTHLGKVLRLTDEGKAPRDNPFYKNRNNKTDPTLPEVWSFGHRNPQGLYIHPETGELWEQEHGPRGGDEINLVKKGLNYGWPIITYGREYWGPRIGEGFVKAGLEQPVKYYVPSIAPCGLLIYSGKKFKQWKGHFFSGALVLEHLNRLKINQKNIAIEEERLLSSLGLRVRDVIEGPQGFIYISTDDGKILRLRPLRRKKM